MAMLNAPAPALAPGLFLIAALLTTCGAQQAAPPNPYARYLGDAHARGQFNGTALIFDHGQVVYQGAFGQRSTETTDRLDLDSQFRLASVSKTFTAMAVMQLKEAGTLRYDQDIRDFLPELPYTGITIRHLLHHTSGLPDYEPLMDRHWKTDLAYDDTVRYTNGNADVLKLLAELKEPVLFSPGDQWRYSNTGYNLLGTIVARASGMPFAAYLKQHIFDPAGMDRTVLYDYVPGRDPKMPDRAYGFQLAWNGRDASPNDGHYLNRGAGEDGVYTTVGDLLKWDRILHTDKLVSRATLDEAFTPGVLNNGDTTAYGFGWYIERSPSGQRVVQHSGGWLGFTTYLYRPIDEDRCVLLLMNNSTRYFWDIARGLTNILYDQPYSLPPLSAAEVLGRDVYDHGAEQAITGFQRSRAARPKDYRVVEDELNLLGYQLLWADRAADAAAILKLTLEEFPRSANAHDSYGDALLAMGDTAGARQAFEQAVALDPSLTATQEKIDGLVKTGGK